MPEEYNQKCRRYGLPRVRVANGISTRSMSGKKLDREYRRRRLDSGALHVHQVARFDPVRMRMPRRGWLKAARDVIDVGLWRDEAWKGRQGKKADGKKTRPGGDGR